MAAAAAVSRGGAPTRGSNGGGGGGGGGTASPRHRLDLVAAGRERKHRHGPGGDARISWRQEGSGSGAMALGATPGDGGAQRARSLLEGGKQAAAALGSPIGSQIRDRRVDQSFSSPVPSTPSSSSFLGLCG
ncbi:hypothetical protein ACP70R_015827 [Stipagrostis hirtigluma subsp. patula]